MNYPAALVFVSITLVWACKQDRDIPAAEIVAVESQHVGRLISGITVRVDSISDTRCPIGANCLIAGRAGAVVQVQKGSEVHSSPLHLGIRNKTFSGTPFTDSVAVSLEGQLYKVILRDITPQPDLTHSQQSAKRAIVQVSKI